MNKINKTQARKEYNSGKDVYLLPSKAAPGSIWIQPLRINNSCGRDFDTLVNEFSIYNCTKETGLRINYYIN